MVRARGGGLKAPDARPQASWEHRQGHRAYWEFVEYLYALRLAAALRVLAISWNSEQRRATRYAVVRGVFLVMEERARRALYGGVVASVAKLIEIDQVKIPKCITRVSWVQQKRRTRRQHSRLHRGSVIGALLAKRGAATSGTV